MTTGKFQVTSVEPESISRKELLTLAAYGECHSNHPIALSVLEAYEKESERGRDTLDQSRIVSVEEMAGYGIHAVLCREEEKEDLYIGNQKLMEMQNVSWKSQAVAASTTLYVARNKEFLGTIGISDTVREDVPLAIEGLRKQGVRSLVMLTGDKESVGNMVAEKLALDRVFGNLLPGDKVQKVEELLEETPADKTLAFVGDGINDAPVLARADVGIAMGGIGSDAAVEAADVVVMNDEPSKIVDCIQIAKKTVTIVKQNIVFAIGVKILVLVLVAFGKASMWAAVFGDVGVSVLAILNAVRALRYQRR